MLTNPFARSMHAPPLGNEPVGKNFISLIYFVNDLIKSHEPNSITCDHVYSSVDVRQVPRITARDAFEEGYDAF